MAEGMTKRKAKPSKQPPSSPEEEKKLDNPSSPPPPPSLNSKHRVVAIFGFLCLLPYLYFLAVLDLDSGVRRAILINSAMSIVGLLSTVLLIPVASKYVLKRGMFGYDINKRGSPGGLIQVPESMGLVSGIVYLVVMILFQHFYFTPESAWLVQYNAALTSICFILFLGFMDDVLDIPWRIKLLLPSFAALPLLMAYAGSTTILIPKPIKGYLGIENLDLGWIYKLYMGLLAVFCTNSINIHAGLNGLEVGQSIIICGAVLVHNITTISSSAYDRQQAHAFSLYLMQPMMGVSLGLLTYNWYPSSVFVGDTYTYFAGMSLAVVGILGHFSETLLLFFLPQILNFLYSLPQLLKIVPCPRHRLPIFDPKTGLLTGTKDMNLVNLFLRLFGRCSELQLLIRLLIFQVLSCGLCFGIRYIMAGWYK